MKEREKKILEYMKAEIREKGYPPTVREICSALGIKSTSTVHKDIASLEREGYLKKDPARPRALLVVDDDFDQLAAVRSASEAGFGVVPGGAADASHGVAEVERADVIDVPVVGRITVVVHVSADVEPEPRVVVRIGSTHLQGPRLDNQRPSELAVALEPPCARAVLLKSQRTFAVCGIRQHSARSLRTGDDELAAARRRRHPGEHERLPRRLRAKTKLALTLWPEAAPP